ncbi:MAG: DNA polymerase III subunit alpha, partial [Acidobacteriota bacterium]
MPSTYAELHAASAFSFLDGASPPEMLVDEAARLGLGAVALIDRGGVSGAPLSPRAAPAAGIRPLVGAAAVLADDCLARWAGADDRAVDDVAIAAPAAQASDRRAAAKITRRDAVRANAAAPRLPLLAADRDGYRRLCRLLTDGARDRPKGDGRVDLAMLRRHVGSTDGLIALSGGPDGPVDRALCAEGPAAARRVLERLHDLLPGRLYVELQRHDARGDAHRNAALVDLARRLRLPLIATQGARYARADAKPLRDVLQCTRAGTTVDRAGVRGRVRDGLLDAHAGRCLRAPAAMARRFADLPEAIGHAAELAARLDFDLDDLGYRFPRLPLPPGETAAGYLRQVAWNGARMRFRPFTARAQQQIAHELDLIEKLDLAGYFLVVWDIIRFCLQRGILVQGRGSAANSAVCYALSITAVDPVKMGLLFERFLSEERGEWPDIDLDLAAGAGREAAIQYVYRRYGPHGAALTANVITYRDRLAAREVAKALGFDAALVDRLARELGRRRWHGRFDDDVPSPETVLRDAGVDPESPRARRFLDLWQQALHLPRHLGQHPGGMIIADGRLDEIVPLEPAAMDGRTVIQWDKDDVADLRLIKVDLLGLGMLNALAEAAPLVRTHEGRPLDLAHLPPDDPKVYAMLRAADTVGVFQVESRAQMSALPRNAPTRFYDLVVQVGLIRPGPVLGGLVNPYLARRQGREPVTYDHPCLEPVLARTLGVPLFQEQLMRMAMAVAGFTGGQAEELRRAMGAKRSTSRMAALEQRLRDGMAERGIEPAAQERILTAITSFARYGFPESHAASFALIAYASAYLKAHHPTAFL